MSTLENPPSTPFRLHLQKGRSGRVRAGHPWVFSNEIAMTQEAKALSPGSLVALVDAGEERLGLGYFNPHTLIAVRMLDRTPDASLDAAWIGQRLKRALALRQRLYAEPCYRLIHAEADGLPGLVIDRFGAVVVVQSNTAGIDRLQPLLLDALAETLAPHAIIWDRSSPVRGLEGLPIAEPELVMGALDGPVELAENGARFLADLRAGQKTGWFFDQRDNRAFVAGLAAGRRVLDLYAYAGGFGVLAAVKGAAEVLMIDRSEDALGLARLAARLNGVQERCRFEKAEAFAKLAALAEAGERFDLVIADPPAFVKSKKDLASGLKGYRKLARLAQTLVAPDGVLFMASCSHHVTAEAFHEEIRHGLGARGGRILRAAGAAPDHPVHPHLPESAYLKALVLALD
ncbi:MAG: class I SAM-dependent rRNA methyltransferase [Rhodospirillales bacterium]|nr:class I SAM-dependent rRNA methyltransferase [Rhodospirillales bacterium]